MKLLDSVKSMSTATYGETTRLRVYRTNLSLNWKVLDFVKRGGPVLTVGRTVFEMWLGSL